MGGIIDEVNAFTLVALLTIIPGFIVAGFLACFVEGRANERYGRAVPKLVRVLGRCSGVAAAAWAICTIGLFSLLTGPGHEVAVVEDSYRIVSFSPEEGGLEVQGSVLDALIVRSYSAEASSRGQYVVMADVKGDGGLSRKAYDVDDAIIYEDAAGAGDARVESVRVCHVLDQEPFGVKIIADCKQETRIHVPAGTMVRNAL